jgi:hypothetical protein
MSKLIHLDRKKVKGACEKFKTLVNSDEELKRQFEYMESIIERVKKERDEKHKIEKGGHKK